MNSVNSFPHILMKIPENERPTEPPVVLSMSRSLDIQALPEGPEGEDTNCPLPEFLHGNKPSDDQVPTTYAVITSCLPNMKFYPSPRNIPEVTTSSPRRRMFRLGRKGGQKGRRLSLKDRWNIFRRRSASLPSYYDSHRDYIPLNSFSSSKEFSSLEDENPNKKQTLKDFFTLDNEINGSERREITVVTPPSTTLLPPREIHPTTQAQSRTTIENQESTIIEILDQGTTLDSNTTEDTPNSLSSSEEIVSNNLTTTTTTIRTISSSINSVLDQVTKSPIVKQNSTPSPATKEGETEENDIEGGDIKLNNTVHRFTVTYWMFYPYSQGKQLCTSKFWFVGRVFKPRLRNKCYGDLITLNSHVGDWEHVSIYFEDNLPQRMYVSTHTHGAYYQYEPNENSFVYRGKDTRIGLPLNPKYPPIIKVDGTHPVLYAALGSHGLWGSPVIILKYKSITFKILNLQNRSNILSPSVHRYENFLPLEDKTVEGTPWKTWKNVDVIDYKDPDHLRMDRQWLQFHGKWGNPANGCYKALLGSCDLASGPTGIPLKRENFPCHLPDHPTFFPEI
ncbi:Vacuolar protein sorting-associated protein 62 [Armadillidium nasatum]|uniref:Vacuolar protein sorting-associated protein 62 n=1 Tax=Armadillidium nasatum TaxID=96803 RepID=A0A5N5TN69_9CRUS|nr:Vacuolar protein sorting-associated protein 62 [Armadillidium nasatum]